MFILNRFWSSINYCLSVLSLVIIVIFAATFPGVYGQAIFQQQQLQRQPQKEGTGKIISNDLGPPKTITELRRSSAAAPLNWLSLGIVGASVVSKCNP